jgi:hypothetical protein
MKEEAFGVSVRGSSEGLWALDQARFDVVPSAFVAEVACCTNIKHSNSKLAVSRSEMIFETSFATKKYGNTTHNTTDLNFTQINPPFLMRRAETGRDMIMASVFYFS